MMACTQWARAGTGGDWLSNIPGAVITASWLVGAAAMKCDDAKAR